MTKNKKRHFTDEFKLRVLSDYYSSGMSKVFIAHKWGLSSGSVIASWQKIWPVEEKELPLLDEIMSRYRMEAKNNGKSDEQILLERISVLERSLQVERMRCRALEEVIEIAEREEGISILKKDGAKQ